MNQADSQRWAWHEIDGLTLLALAYLALPNLIFIFGWFHWPVAVVLCAALLHLLYRALPARTMNWHREYFPAATLMIIAAGVAWAAFGGGSHFMYANPDWTVRDAVLGDLVYSDWPVHYLSPEGVQLLLRSAIGYFLPLAMFGRIFGIAQLEIAVYLWTTVGVLIFLFLLPLPRRAGWPLAWGLGLVVFFSGMDFVGQFIATESLPIFPMRLEWWVPLSYPSLTNQLLWAPNHCLPMWIGSVLILRHLNSQDFLRMSAALLPLTLIWTPFAAIGLLPFVLLGAVKSFGQWSWRSLPLDAAMSGLIFSTPLILFLILDAAQIDARFASTAPTGFTYYTMQQASLHSYLLFITCEFLFLALVLTPHLRQSRDVFGLAVLILLSLPLIRFGVHNDALLRLSPPALIVLLVACLQTLFDSGRSLSRSTMIVACLFLAIGAHTAFNEFWRAASWPRTHANYKPTLADIQNGQPAAHYVGHLGSSFVRRLLKPLGAPASETNRRSPQTYE
ncbi:MAG: hypothetical protein K9J42_07455 [Sulfuritalea sp.]|nr:hypothetical protein [Sulfuritalea sp.]